MQRKARVQSIVLMLSLTLAGLVMVVVLRDAPALPLSAAAATAVAAGTTLLWVLASTNVRTEEPPVESTADRIKVLLYDAERLRTQTQKLHEDLARALAELPRDDGDDASRRAGAASG